MTSDGRPRPLVAVLDYGIGNLRSAEKALTHVGADARLTADHGLIADADAVVLPGVGAFGRCMEALRGAGLEEPALAAVASGRPFLGICIGMQMLFESSEEDPAVNGLGVLPGRVVWIPSGVKRPQMQWNRLDLRATGRAAVRRGWANGRGCTSCTRSTVCPHDPADVVATCEYGGTLNAAFRRDNVFAVQFHPEKSGREGLALLANFAAVAAGALTT